MFITNNLDSFHLWWKKKLVKHQKVSKYYYQDCSLLKSAGKVFSLPASNLSISAFELAKSHFAAKSDGATPVVFFYIIFGCVVR